MVENLGIYNKKTSNKKLDFLKIFSKKQKIAFSEVAIIFEEIKLKIRGLRSFVDHRLMILMHTRKIKIHFFFSTGDAVFLDISIENRQKSLLKNP
jgi:hypothetical protein